MEDILYFHQMFPDCDISEALRSLLINTVIRHADIDIETRYIFAELYSPTYIPERCINEVRAALKSQYDLHGIDFDVYHPADQLCCLEDEELRNLFVRYDSMARGSLAGAAWKWEDTHLTVQLRGNGKDALVKNAPQIARQLSIRFGTEVTIDIETGKATSKVINKYTK